MKRDEMRRMPRARDLITKKQPEQRASAEYLRSAEPRLICRVERPGGLHQKLTPHITEVYRGWDHLIDEGYDPNSSPLCRPVYWRIVKRGDNRFYFSTFLMTRDEIVKGWGTEALTFCDPVTGMAVARIETLLTRPPKTDQVMSIGGALGNRQKEAPMTQDDLLCTAIEEFGRVDYLRRHYPQLMHSNELSAAFAICGRIGDLLVDLHRALKEVRIQGYDGSVLLPINETSEQR
jgi:hypothetical protein